MSAVEGRHVGDGAREAGVGEGVPGVVGVDGRAAREIFVEEVREATHEGEIGSSVARAGRRERHRASRVGLPPALGVEEHDDRVVLRVPHRARHPAARLAVPAQELLHELGREDLGLVDGEDVAERSPQQLDLGVGSDG